MLKLSATNLIFKQFAKYLAVGVLSNGLAYGLYLGIVQAGVNPILSMTMVYILASSVAFNANWRWTFRSEVNLSRSAIRYVASQIIGYVTNLLLLAGLYYVLGVPHHLAQIMGIGVVAIQLFLLNRYYVFS